MKKDELGLSFSARKALTVHLGEAAGNEIATLLQRMAAQIDEHKKINLDSTTPDKKGDGIKRRRRLAAGPSSRLNFGQ